MSSGENLIFRMARLTDFHRAEVICVLFTEDHHSLLQNRLRGVLLVVMCCRKWSAQLQMSSATHTRGCPVSSCLMGSPLNIFFCVVRIIITKVASAQVMVLRVVAGVYYSPTNNWISRILKGLVTVPPPPCQYSTGLRRKKK